MDEKSITHVTTEEFPSDGGMGNSETIPKKKSRKRNLIIPILILLIPIAICVLQIVRSSSIKNNSILTAATLVDSNNAYIEVTPKASKTGSTRNKYYELEVYQHLVVQYTIDGEEFTKDIGVHKVYDIELPSNIPQSERDNYLRSHTYETGDTFDVYVTDDDTVQLESSVKERFSDAVFVIIIVVGIFVFSAIYELIKKYIFGMK